MAVNTGVAANPRTGRCRLGSLLLVKGLQTQGGGRCLRLGQHDTLAGRTSYLLAHISTKWVAHEDKSMLPRFWSVELPSEGVSRPRSL